MHYVYSLKFNDGYYVGCTLDLKDRVSRHQRGEVAATKNRLPFKIEFYIAIGDKNKAFKLEKYFKSGSGRSFLKKHF